MNVALIVLSWNGAAWLPTCFRAIAAQTRRPDQVMLVDNGSTDDSVAVVQQLFPDVVVVQNVRNLGFGAGMNVGLKQLMHTAPPDVVVLLNQDTEVSPTWLEALLAPFDDPQVAMVGAKAWFADGVTLQHAGGEVSYPRATTRHYGYGERDDGQYDERRDTDYVTGAAVALRIAPFALIGWFDEGYNPAYFEEVDVAFRLRAAGYRVVYEPTATLRHAESSSTTEFEAGRMAHRHRIRFVLKHYATAAVWHDFLPAEHAHAQASAGSFEARVLKVSYADALLQLPDTLQARAETGAAPFTPSEQRRLAHALAELRRMIIETEVRLRQL